MSFSLSSSSSLTMRLCTYLLIKFALKLTLIESCRRDWKAVCSALLQRKRIEQCYEDVLLPLAEEVVIAIRIQSFDAMFGVSSLMPYGLS